MRANFHLPTIMIAVIAALISNIADAQSSGQLNQVPLPKDAFINLDGSVNFHPKEVKSLAVRSLAIGTPDSFLLPLIPTVSRKSIDKRGIETLLNTIFDNWATGTAKYAGHIMLLAGPLPLSAAGVQANLLTSPPNTIYMYKPYNLNQSTIGIPLLVPQQLVTADPFKQPSAGAPFPAAAIFTRVDPFGSPVPLSISAIFETDFLNGLVTRLTLEQYVSFWKTIPGSKIDVNLDGGFGTSPSDPFGAFTLLGNYPNGKSLDNDLVTIVQANPVNPIGMVLGWQAANDLIKADKAAGNQILTKAIWQLINSRLTLEQIGKSTSYTLQYMSGFALNERIVAIVNTPGTAPNPTTLPSAFSSALQNTPTFQASKAFLSSFSDVLNAEYYAASQNQTPGLSPNKQALLTEYYYFTRGFNSGVISASDDMFLELSQTAYQSGYDQGFRDGFSAGYNAGLSAGYAIGYQTAWAQANITITQLQSTIASLRSQLAAAQQSQSTDGGFWDTVGNIISVGGSAIGVIASLF